MKAYGSVDRVYSGSPSIIDELRQFSPALRRNAKCIFNFVDYRGYRHTEQTFPGGSVSFMYVGRFTADKGLESLIRGFLGALAKRHEGFPSIFLRLLGPQSMEEGADPDFVGMLKAIAAPGIASGAIAFEAPIYDRSRLEREIRRANVLCLPSLGGETLNMTMLEALRLSKPILVSDIPPNAPLVEPGLNGQRVKAGDENSWTAAMLAMAADLNKLSNLSQGAFQYGEANFSKQLVIDAYLADFDLLRSRTPAK
jgi:glycosyltransferase involved in cell wall biosynthesis